MEQEPKRKAWPGLIAGGVAACLALSLLWTGGARAVETSAPALLEVPRQTAGQPVEDEVGDMVIPLGKAVGIKLFSDGVLVVGLSEVTGPTGDTSPARACGLRQGDIITHINDTQVDTIEEVRSVLQDLEGDKMSIRALRAEEPVQFTAQAVACADGTYRLGAWIRDSMAGIGTMTFYEPSTGLFGALGHGITDVDTALLMPLESGAHPPRRRLRREEGGGRGPGRAPRGLPDRPGPGDAVGQHPRRGLRHPGRHRPGRRLSGPPRRPAGAR